jgi:hypothetical protein
MKKTLLFVLALCIGASSMAQQSYKYKVEPKHKTINEVTAIGIDPIKDHSIVTATLNSIPTIPSPDRDVNIVNIINIGTSANPWSYVSNNVGNQRSMVWADPELNIVTNFHRMGGILDLDGNSGDLGYDISFDGGATWTNQIECYVAENAVGNGSYYDNARYPSHGIYNPTGNVEDAHIAFFTPNLDGSNADSDYGWGGYSRGTAKISDPSVTTKNLFSSADDVHHYIPEAYDLTSQGLSICVDKNVDWTNGTPPTYQGSLIINAGKWNDTEEAFVYEQSLLDFDLASQPWFIGVAFAPDGMTGYIAALGNDGTTWSVDGHPNIYPIIFKSTDGGETWSDPYAIQIDGPDGIGGVVNHLVTDEDLDALYDGGAPARDEIPYTFTGDFDIAVTANGNLHIAGLIGIAGEAEDGISFYTTNNWGKIIDLFTKDGGTTWEVEEMGGIQTYDYAWGDGPKEANRTQITLNPDANTVFISWLDTDIEDAEDNDRPNIWCRGFKPSTYMKTANAAGEDAPTNVTLFSEGMWQSYFATAAKTSLETSPGVYTIPYVYVDWDTSDDTAPVQYKYISDFSISDSDFTVLGIEDQEAPTNNLSSVSQNFPNPFNNESYVTVNLSNASNLSVEVYTLTGQLVSAKDYGYKTNGSHTLTINGADLNSGIYFYTVTAGENKVTRKMIVE